MRSLILFLTLAASAFLPTAASASPCLSSSEAVFTAHPGVHVHADWHFIDNRKCWMAKGEFDGRSISSRSGTPRNVDGLRHHGVDGRNTALVPLPKPRPVAARRHQHSHSVVVAAVVPSLPTAPAWVRTVAAPAEILERAPAGSLAADLWERPELSERMREYGKTLLIKAMRETEEQRKANTAELRR